MKKFMAIVLSLGMCLAICNTDSWATEVKGNNANWTFIGTVKQGSVIKIHASGIVDFGCRLGACKDSATAGIDGSSALTSTFQAFKNGVVMNAMNPDFYKTYFGNTHPPKFDQGGAWIKVVTKSGTPYIGTQLYYYWAHGDGINKYGLPINVEVDVFAKAHDGGRSPDSMKGYGDNKGSYTVSIEYVTLPAIAKPPQGVTVQPPPVQPPPVRVAPTVTEDCLAFNPNTTTVANIQGRWKIVDGNHGMFDFGIKESEARLALAIIKKYGFNNVCYVGRPQSSFQYLLRK